MLEPSDLSELVSGRSEDLGVEYKAWMDTNDNGNRANLARHIAALANHGGGYLIFGINDTTREPQGQTHHNRKLFSQDGIAGIARRYLDPCPAIRVADAEHEGVSYPVVIVPSHGARPVCAKSDGPTDPNKKSPIGIQQGVIYIRAPGPESRPIRTSEEWSALLDRCLALKADLIASIVRRSMASPVGASADATKLLAAAVDSTSEDFAAQAMELAQRLTGSDADRVRRDAKAFCTMGYALIGGSGDLVELEDPRALAERADVGMHQFAHKGWSLFSVLRVPERAPQRRQATLLEAEHAYLEGMRISARAVLGGTIDYWRIYECGIVTTTVNYEEDWIGRQGNPPLRYISTLHSLFRLHGVLAHARFVGLAIPDVQRVLMRLDWHDLAGRPLLSTPHERFCDGTPADPRFAKTMALTLADLHDGYSATLRKVATHLFGVFPAGHAGPVGARVTDEFVAKELARFNQPTLRLFD
jgi:hypothetical protein